MSGGPDRPDHDRQTRSTLQLRKDTRTMRRDRSRRVLPILALAASVPLVLSACGSSDDTAATTKAPAATKPDVVITATEFSYKVPDPITGGWTTLTLDNQGGEQHQLSLARLGDGQEASQVEALLDQGDLSFLAQATLVGGPDGVVGGQEGSVFTDLEPGRYVMFCAVPSPSDGVAHYRKGMRTSFTVGALTKEGTPPNADGTVTITAQGYEVPKGFTGDGTFAVTNKAATGAEMAIMRLAAGATQQDLVTYLTGRPSGPPPFTAAGGVSAMAPGSTTYIDLDLDPGTYVFMSFVPDPTAGFKPQFTNGVISTVTIP